MGCFEDVILEYFEDNGKPCYSDYIQYVTLDYCDDVGEATLYNMLNVSEC